MEHILRCNSLKCRRPLDQQQAVVTTCSHIYCLPCSDALGLTEAQGDTRVCPACAAKLPQPDDAVIAQLNPTEDYKTSVLSGLTPTIILECASRALAFYNYQTSQEIVYQEYLAKSLAERHTKMDNKLTQIVSEANAELRHLHSQMDAMSLEQRTLEAKNESLAAGMREKSRKLEELQKMYKKSKLQQQAGELEMAADMNAETVLHGASINPRDHLHYRQGGPVQSRGGSNGTGPRVRDYDAGSQYGPYASAVNRSGIHSARGTNMPATPSGHHQNLPCAAYNSAGAPQNTIYQQGTPHRQQLQSLQPNLFGKKNSPRVGGMSAGLKMARHEPAVTYFQDPTRSVRPLNVR